MLEFNFFNLGNYFKSKKNFILCLNSVNVNEIKNKANMNINKCYYIIFNKVNEEFEKIIMKKLIIYI